MAPRLDLQAILVALLGSTNVYFQPPASVQMKYPCIVYERGPMRTFHADDRPYSIERRYQLTVIDQNPDSEIPGKVALLPKCRHDQHFAADNLNHDVFTIFF